MRSSNELSDGPGTPAVDRQDNRDAGSPFPLRDRALIERLARFNREYIPEGVVSAAGSNACGVFEVTNPGVSRWTRTRMFSEAGKRTEVFVRFSTVGGHDGAADAMRSPRIFAVKFYTEDGNWDVVGSNIPVYFVRDPKKSCNFLNSQNARPYNSRSTADGTWSFFSRSPEATHAFTWLFGDNGLPRSWRRMNGYGVHTFRWVNALGDRFWVKFHFETDEGCDCVATEGAARIPGEDRQHLQRDLFRAIERGHHPSWTLKVQIMPEADAAACRIDPFDPTGVWPHGDYPSIEIGRMTLDRLPDNDFAEVEQSAFDPGHTVPGVGPGPGRMLQARLFAYGDAHRCRLGAGRAHPPANDLCIRPFAGSPNCARDEAMPSYGHGGSYGPEIREADDFTQAGGLYRLMPEAEKERLTAAIAGSLSQVQRTEIGDAIVCRSIRHFCRADREYGRRVALAVKARRGGVRTACLRASEAAKTQS